MFQIQWKPCYIILWVFLTLKANFLNIETRLNGYGQQTTCWQPKAKKSVPISRLKLIYPLADIISGIITYFIVIVQNYQSHFAINFDDVAIGFGVSVFGLNESGWMVNQCQAFSYRILIGIIIIFHFPMLFNSVLLRDKKNKQYGNVIKTWSSKRKL